MSAAAVLLAAGAGTRFAAGPDAGHKLLAPFRGRPVVWWAARHAIDAGIGPTWVVTGAVDLSSVLPAEAETIANPDWEDGQSTSLQRAVRRARQAGLDAIVVGLGDQPMIGPDAWRAVASASAVVAVAAYDGRRRNPVRLGSQVWDLLPSSGDEGARVLMRERPDLVGEVPCQGEPVDIDTREDLQEWS
jgi:molybdenum cofactor cytidylyltransferase